MVVDDLSQRELAVLRLLASELSLREIGDALYISRNTVKTHGQRIYRKLGADTRAGPSPGRASCACSDSAPDDDHASAPRASAQ